MRIGKLALMLAALLCVCAAAAAMDKGDTPPESPDWVFDHWVWEDDVNTQQAVFDLVDGYAKHDIPVGAVIIDSPWATEYNNFEWNTEAYPDPQGMIDELHDRGIRVVLWMTSVLNDTSNNGEFEPRTNSVYKEALAKGYLASDGRLTKWWKGMGGYIDYTNPEAVEWWHGLMDRVLLMGIDGWKCDGTGIMFPNDGYGMGDPADPNRKPIPMNGMDYKDLYYMDSYEHLLSRNPEGATISRPVDLRLAAPSGFAPISHSPANWVGDEVHDWSTDGFIEALQDIFDSARLGYSVMGSDIAGYNGSMQIEKNLLLRWAQFGALCPFMENGGHGKHQPWLHDQEAVDIYRKFVLLHQSLKPYFYSMMMKSHQGGGPIMRPVSGLWQYKLGPALFAAVVYEDTTEREIQFPSGEWIDYWDNSKVFNGGETVNYDVPLDRYPLFIRRGAIIPLYDFQADYGYTETFHGAVTLDIYPAGNRSFELYEPGQDKVDVDVATDENKVSISVSPAGNRQFIFRVHLPDGFAKVLSGDKEIKEVYPESLSAKPLARVTHGDKLYINPGHGSQLDVDIILK